MCAYQGGRNNSLGKNFAYLLNAWSDKSALSIYVFLFKSIIRKKDGNIPVLGQCSISILPEIRKTSGFLMFSASIAMGQWFKIG